MSEQSLRVRGSNFPTEQALEQINNLVAKLGESKALPAWCDNPGKLLMCVLAGRESGMGPVEALNSFYLVNGKFTMFGAAVITQLKRCGYRVKWGECTDQTATVTIIAPNGDEHTETYTMKEALLAGNTQSNAVWKKYPKRMLQFKAIGGAVRMTCPEVLNGTYIREELDGSSAPQSIDADFSEKEMKEVAEETLNNPITQ